MARARIAGDEDEAALALVGNANCEAGYKRVPDEAPLAFLRSLQRGNPTIS